MPVSQRQSLVPLRNSPRVLGRHYVAAVAVLAMVTTSTQANTSLGQDGLVQLVAQAVALEHGEGVEKDPKKAFELYCLAAREGNAEAQYSLGWMYANARGVERNDAMAALFFDMAAERGHEHALKLRQRFGDRADSPPDCMRPPQVATLVDARGDATGDSASPSIQNVPKKIADLVNRLSPEYKINPQLALAVIQAESNFNPNARSQKNALGLMQLIPETAQRFNVSKPFDPEQNIRGGLAYLRWLLAYFKGNVPLVAAGYNAGEGTVDKHRGVPPYPETKGYVQRILALYQGDKHPFDSRVVSPSAGLMQFRAVR